MRTLTKSVLVFVLSCLMLVVSSFAVVDSSLAAGPRCYWMENYSGEYNWVDAPQGDITKEECYGLDSCDGGLGQSGGGCYKWAIAPTADRISWEDNDQNGTTGYCCTGTNVSLNQPGETCTVEYQQEYPFRVADLINASNKFTVVDVVYEDDNNFKQPIFIEPFRAEEVYLPYGGKEDFVLVEGGPVEFSCYD